LICTPNFETFSISSSDTPLGVKIIFSGLKPAFNPRWTSWIETVSIPDPSELNNLRTEILESALTA